MPQVSVLDGLPAEAAEEARWWERHLVEVVTGVPPDAGEGTVPRPEYDPGSVTLTRREQAKAAELTAAGHPVTASAVAKRRRRYLEQGLAGMVDYRARRRMPPHGRAGAAVVAAMRKAIGEAAEDATKTAAFVFRRTREILAEDGGETGRLPSERTLYRLFARLEAGRHTTGSARTRRSLAARPEGPFGRVPAAAPGDVMQIDSTPLDVLVRLDNGVTGRVDLTGLCARLNTDRCRYDHSPCSHGDPRGRCTTRPGTLPIRKRCPPGFGVRRTAYGRSWMKREYRTGCRSCCRRGSSTTPS